jgi:ABC-type ATPase with predicted acetyltransferase domain
MSKDSPDVVDKTIQLDKTGMDTLLALMTHKTITAAAQSLEITRKALYDRIDKYQLDIYLEQVPRKALSVLQNATVDAAETLVKKLDSSRQDFEAALEILNRAGVGVRDSGNPTNIQINNLIESKKEKYDI